jgi:hypothetical protein
VVVARRMLTGVAVTVVVALVALAGAAAADLDAAAVTLRAADLPGAKVTSQKAVKEPGYSSAFERSFTYKAPNGRAGVLAVEAESAVAATAAQVTTDLSKVRRSLANKTARANLIKNLAANLKVKPSSVKIGALRTPHVGDSALELPLTVTVKGGRIYLSFLYMQLDRVFANFLTIAIRPIALSDAAYATSVAALIGTALTPTDLAPPTVTGTPQQGQTLTAVAGTWSAADATFAYQWQKCDAAGANCVDISGATAQTYVVAPTDVAATLRVNVIATNRFGSSLPAPSAVTAAVT